MAVGDRRYAPREAICRAVCYTCKANLLVIIDRSVVWLCWSSSYLCGLLYVCCSYPPLLGIGSWYTTGLGLHLKCQLDNVTVALCFVSRARTHTQTSLVRTFVLPMVLWSSCRKSPPLSKFCQSQIDREKKNVPVREIKNGPLLGNPATGRKTIKNAEQKREKEDKQD